MLLVWTMQVRVMRNAARHILIEVDVGQMRVFLLRVAAGERAEEGVSEEAGSLLLGHGHAVWAAALQERDRL